MNSDIMVWLDASSPTFLSKDGHLSGDSPASGEVIGLWADRSGKGHHARTVVGSPVWVGNLMNGQPTVSFSSSIMKLDDSVDSFDEWEELEVFVVMDLNSTNTWQGLFGKFGTVNSETETSWHMVARRPDQDPPKFRFRVHGTTGTDWTS